MAQNILVVGPAWIGDMVMAQSLFKTLVQNGENRLDVIAPVSTRPLLKRMPEVREAFEIPIGHGQLQLGLRREMGRQLQHTYQQAIVMPGSFKSALLPWFAKIPQRTGYRGEMRYGLLNDIRKLRKAEQPLCVQRFVSLGLPAGQTAGDDYPYPGLVINAENQRKVLDRFELDQGRPILALCPGAEYGSSKRWPMEYFEEVARGQIEQGSQVWVFGSDKDRQRIEKHLSDLGAHIHNLAGKTSLGEAIDLLALADKVVSNDSGLMHIAAALELDLIALYGSSSPDFTPPLSKRCRILSLQLDCRPCFKRECPLGHFDCMKKLSPAKVLEAIESFADE